jgi:CelD/BcsL family acetyltransferase involved in cellulose biosynthesis
VFGVEVVRTSAGLEGLKADYDRLHVLCGNTLPFALHEWHVAWWNHLAKAEGRIRDELRIHVVRDDLGQCVAIVPFVATRREIGYLKSETLSLLGADPNFTELRTPLVLPGQEGAVAKAVTRHLAMEEGWDWVRWSGIQGSFGEELSRSASLIQHAPGLDYLVDLAPTWDAFKAGLKRNIRESLRHCYNSVKRDGLALDFEVAATPDEVRNALHIFLSLHAMRAAAKGTVTHPHRFESHTSREFLYEVCERLAQRDAARVFLLKIRGCVVAARIGFVVGDQLYLYYSGFDPRWGKYSVPTTVVAEAMKYAIEKGLKAVNLSTGTDVSKTRWGARLVTFQEAVQPSPGFGSRVKYAAYKSLQDGHHPQWMAPILNSLPKRAWT